MKSVWIRVLLILCLAAAILLWLGIGPYSSSSAVSDLKAELESIYGTEYTGKLVENGTEDMVFAVRPKSWFLTNWKLRDALGMDYRYECQVIFTTHTGGDEQLIRTVTYRAIDPMGQREQWERASLDLDSKVEAIQVKLTGSSKTDSSK